MNLENAIDAHVNWKLKLSRYLANPDKSVNSAQVSKDNVCELGTWLHGDGRKYASNPDFARLIQEHARFHQVAGDIVRRADLGQKVSAEATLGSSSQFAQTSSAVVQLIMKVRKSVG